MASRCPLHRVRGDQPVKRHENASMFYSQRQQVEIGDLARPVDSRGVEDCGIEQAQVVRPEFMKAGSARLCKPFNYG
jgi:hypothetical protein